MSTTKDEHVQLDPVIDALVTRCNFLESEIKRVTRLHDQLENRIAKQKNAEMKLDWALSDLEDAKKTIENQKEQLSAYEEWKLLCKANETAKWLIEARNKRPRED